MTDLFHCNCPHCGQPMPDQTEATFAQFWADCPNKVNKAQSEKAWRKLTKPDRDAAHKAVKRFYAKFAADYPQASPLHPSTYLNGKRWQDLEPQKSADNDKLRAFHEANLNSKVDGIRRAAERYMAQLEVKQ